VLLLQIVNLAAVDVASTAFHYAVVTTVFQNVFQAVRCTALPKTLKGGHSFVAVSVHQVVKPVQVHAQRSHLSCSSYRNHTIETGTAY
jgi:predicted transporter